MFELLATIFARGRARLSAMVAATLVALAGACASAALLQLFRARLPADAPNARSLHRVAVPRAGGWIIWAGFLPAALLWPPAFPGGLAGWLAGWAILVVVSALDDRRPLPIALRLSVHVAAAASSAAWLCLPGTSAANLPPALVWLAATLLIAWSLNLYNFMDGSDGMASAMAVTGFGALAIGSAIAGEPQPALVALAVAAGAFLLVNAPPARMFMGDVGAVPLGFLAATFGIAGMVEARWPPWFPALVFLPFWGDATVTLSRRALHRERIWQAHNSHYYQRLVRLGAGHAGALGIYAGLMVACALTALCCLRFAPRLGTAALLAWIVIVSAVFAVIDYHWRRQSPTTP